MSTMVMQKLLCLSLACYTFAAPITHKLEARQFPGRGPADQGSWQHPPSGVPGGGPRQWGVLYPRPPGPESQQGSFPDASPSDPTFSGGPFDSNSPLPTTSSIPPAGPPVSTALPPAANLSGTTSPLDSSVQSPSTTFAASAVLADDIGSSSTTDFPQPSSSPASAIEPLSASPLQPSIPADTAPLQATPGQPTSAATSSGAVLPTTLSQPLIPANTTQGSPSTTTLQPTGSATNSASSSSNVLSQPSVPANTTWTWASATVSQSTTSSAATSTLSTSFSLPPTAPTSTPPTSSAVPLQLSLVNNLPSNNARAYISAVESSSGRVVMLTTAGTFYYLPEIGSVVPQSIGPDVSIPLPPQGQSLQIAIPGFVEGARVWFADGTLDFAVVSSINGPALVEPTAVRKDDGSAYTNWGFVELAYVEGYGLFANLSFVDFVGLPLGLQLQTWSNGTQAVPGMPRDGVQQACDLLRQYRGKAARHWADLCVSDTNGNPMRVISPAVLLSQRPNVFPAFFQRYVDKVWDHYSANPLMINTQTGNGNIVCRVVGDEMQCDGDNRGYAKPSAGDIFGCDSGPFSVQKSDGAVHRAVVPRLCAAFNRGTLMLEGGEVQPALPPASYYTARPHNVYSAVAHAVELEGRGYTFSYDDVAPTPEENVAGTVAAADPQLLTVFVGGM